MGEYADEAMQLGLNQMDYEYRNYGCADHTNPRYNENLWEDCFGVVRKIRDMDSMHLRFTIEYIKTLACAKKMSGRIAKMEAELKRRDFTEEDYQFNKVGCDLRLYCMYPNEADNRIRHH